MAPIPAFDLALDEQYVALSYVAAGFATSPEKKDVAKDEDVVMTEEKVEKVEEGEPQERRMVSIFIKPCGGVDPVGLYSKIKETIVSTPEYRLKWDDDCKVCDGNKIETSFTIALEADFDEEVMEWIEMMEDEVENQGVIFQTAME